MSEPRPLVVAFVIQTYAPVIGGSERQLQALLPHLVGNGVQPLVITRGLPGEPDRTVIDGVKVQRHGSIGHGAIGSFVFATGALWTLARLRPDVIHAFSLMTPTTIAWLHRRLHGTPVVVKALRGGVRGDLDRISRKPFFRWRKRLLGADIDAAQVISEEIDSEFDSLGVVSQRRFRITNGVDLSLHGDGSSKDADWKSRRESLGFGPEDWLFIAVGRLASEKQLDCLIDAFREVSERHSDVKLLIVGEGPERGKLERLSAGLSTIRFFGASECVSELLALADVSVQSSATEGMSNAVLEAMAAGLPVIATDVGAASELLGEHDDRGWLIRGDATDTTTLVTSLISAMIESRDRALSRARGQHARTHVEDHFSLESRACALSALYERLFRPEDPR